MYYSEFTFPPAKTELWKWKPTPCEGGTCNFLHQCPLRSKDPTDLHFSSSHSLFSLSPLSSSSFFSPHPIPIRLLSTIQFPLWTPRLHSSSHSSTSSLTRLPNPLRFAMTRFVPPEMSKRRQGSSMRRFRRQNLGGWFEIRSIHWGRPFEFTFMICRGSSLTICCGCLGILTERPLISPPMAAPSTASLNRYSIVFGVLNWKS